MSEMPIIVTVSPVRTMPCSMRPVTTVPRPMMLNTSSTDMEKGLSSALWGSGMYSSTESMSFKIASLQLTAYVGSMRRLNLSLKTLGGPVLLQPGEGLIWYSIWHALAGWAHELEVCVPGVQP